MTAQPLVRAAGDAVSPEEASESEKTPRFAEVDPEAPDTLYGRPCMAEADLIHIPPPRSLESFENNPKVGEKKTRPRPQIVHRGSLPDRNTDADNAALAGAGLLIASSESIEGD